VRRDSRKRLRRGVVDFGVFLLVFSDVDECLVPPGGDASRSLVFRVSFARSSDRRCLFLLRSTSLLRRWRNESMPLMLPVLVEVVLLSEEVVFSMSRGGFDLDVRRLPEIFFMMRECYCCELIR